jgi:hypothetical protein
MPVSPEVDITPFEESAEINKFPSTPLPLFGELVEGVPVDINFIQTGEDYCDNDTQIRDNSIDFN